MWRIQSGLFGGLFVAELFHKPWEEHTAKVGGCRQEVPADHLALQKQSVSKDAAPPGRGSHLGQEPEEKASEAANRVSTKSARSKAWGKETSVILQWVFSFSKSQKEQKWHKGIFISYKDLYAPPPSRRFESADCCAACWDRK